MSVFNIEKSPNLNGEVEISGAKNAALPILAATLLTDKENVIENVPYLKDVNSMYELLDWLGVSIGINDNNVKLVNKKIKTSFVPYELASKMRASFLVMGPLLAKTGKVRISLPGGCPIGNRPIDLHLKGFEAMGAKITQGHGYVEAKARKLKGSKIYLDFPSVGATENILMASCFAEGKTIIENAAVEPEIVNLSKYLVSMGAVIKGGGTDTIEVEGVKSLNGCSHKVIPDRIEAGTFMIAAAITKGEVKVKNIIQEHLKPIIAKLREIGTVITEGEDYLIIKGSDKLKCVDIKTLPFPGFPTDMQSQFMSLMSLCEGTSIITETIFENRFLHVAELKRMGAKIKIDGRSAVIEGTKKFSGAQVKATDLRAGAALVLAGLVADGQTQVSEIEHMDRGYYKFDEKLSQLGAKISRQEVKH